MEETFRKELQSEVKLVLEMTARVDERVKLVVEKQQEMTTRLNSFIDSHNQLSARVSVLEHSSGNRPYRDLKEKFDGMSERLTKIEAQDIRERLSMVDDAVKEIVKSSQMVLEENRERMTDLVHRISKIEDQSESLWGKLKAGGGLIVQGFFIIIMAYILFQMGLKN